MTIEIIKRGKVPEERPYEVDCSCCLSELRFIRTDASLETNSDGDWLVINCPVCNIKYGRRIVGGIFEMISCWLCGKYSDLEYCYYKGQDIFACSACVWDFDKGEDDDRTREAFNYDSCFYLSGFRCGGEHYSDCIEIKEESDAYALEPFFFNVAYIGTTVSDYCARCLRIHELMQSDKESIRDFAERLLYDTRFGNRRG